MNHDWLDSSERTLAIDSSRYFIRAALTEPITKVLLDSCEAKPEQPERVIRFVQRSLDPKTVVVGSPHDCWPSGLANLFCEESGIQVNWLNSNPLQPMLWHLAPWHKKQRLNRARLLAYLWDLGPMRGPEIARLALEWQCHLHREAFYEALYALEPMRPGPSPPCPTGHI
jgi:hypothetical protein